MAYLHGSSYLQYRGKEKLREIVVKPNISTGKKKYMKKKEKKEKEMAEKIGNNGSMAHNYVDIKSKKA